MYEHRVRDGVVVDGPVHHVNGVKHDNRPENLVYCASPAEHRVHHRSIDRGKIVDLYQAGTPTTTIAERLGVDRGYVSRVLSACGIPARPVQKVDEARIKVLIASGIRTQDIADSLGVCYGTVSAWRRRLGLPGKPGRRRGDGRHRQPSRPVSRSCKPRIGDGRCILAGAGRRASSINEVAARERAAPTAPQASKEAQVHHGQGIGSILVVAAGLLVIGVGVRAADGGALPAESGSPSPSASPTASPSPVVPPADSGTVRWALKWRRAAVHVWAQWNRARRCLALRVVPFGARSARAPYRAASHNRWMDAGRGWKHDRGVYNKRTAELLYRMRHPGGSSCGARWLPLARWVGWPAFTWSMLTAVITRESSGREKASNGGVYLGLMQVWRSHVAARFWGRLYTAEYNLRVGLRLWHESRWGPWAQTAY